MTQVTANFIRNYRKHHCLDKQGRVYPGEEQRARLLLDVLQLAQRGRVDDAVDIAYRIYGLDLEAAHADFVSLRQTWLQRSRDVWAAMNAGTGGIIYGDHFADTRMLAAS